MILRLYQGIVFVFVGESLVTCWRLPQAFARAA